MIKQQVAANGNQPWVDDEFRANDSSLYKNPEEKPEYA
jgi:hypothetical protein